MHPRRHSLDTETLSEEVEIDIAGLGEGSFEIDKSVAALPPTAETVSVQHHRTVTENGLSRINQSLLETRQGEKRFDRGAGGVHTLQTAVLQRMSGIL